jgi:FMN phosphatase YigB (HAD superfamily)
MIFTAYGISKEEYYASYCDPNDKRPVKSHDLEDQTERLKKSHSFDEEALRKALDDFMQDTSGYVFEDVPPFVDLHKDDELMILSFGSKVFQEKKIRSSKIQNHVPNIIITDKPKSEALADALKKVNILSGEKVVLIDDRTEQIRSAKEKFPQVVTILLKRPEGRYQDMEQDQYCDFEAHNLKEAQAIIKKLTNRNFGWNRVLE